MEGALGSHYTFAPLSVEALLELKDLFDSGEKVGDNVELRDAKAGRVRQQEVLGSLKNSKLDMEHEDRMKCFENVFREISLLKKYSPGGERGYCVLPKDVGEAAGKRER